MTRPLNEQDERTDGLCPLTWAARRLQMSYNRAYNRASTGLLGEVKQINGRLYVSTDAVIRYAEAHPQEATA